MKKSIRLGVVFAFILLLLGVSQVHAAIPQERIDAAEAYIQQMMQQYRMPGMAVVMVADGEIVYSKGYGFADAEGTQPVDINTVFQLASVSKNMTAMAVTQLAERGQLSLDDRVTTYIPWFASKDKENSDKITIKHLLQHTSGIPTRAYGLQIKDSTPDQLEEQVKRLSKTNLTAQPGVRHQYSNMNYWTLALIVEKVSGMKFSDYMEQNIFGPLGMERSGYYNKFAGSEHVAMGHRMEKGKHVPFDYTVPGTTIAAGGVYSTATDMGKYVALLLNGGTYGGVRILSSESIEAMFTDVARLNPQIGYGYGFYNMSMGDDDGYLIHHGGDNPNFTAHMYLSPIDHFGFAIMANTQHAATHGIATNLIRILFGGETRPFIPATVADQNLVNMLDTAKLVIYGMIALWTLIVLIGLATRRYVFFKGRRSLARFILQAILLPLFLFAAAGVCYMLPVMMIGSMDVARLYQPDQVNVVISLTLALIALGLVSILFGFVSKAKRVVIRAGQAR